MPIRVRVTIAGGAHILDESELDRGWFAGLGGNGVAQQVVIAIVHPVAEKSVWRLQCSGAGFYSDEIERTNPGLVTDLSQGIAQAVRRFLPDFIHTLIPRAGWTLVPKVCINRKS